MSRICGYTDFKAGNENSSALINDLIKPMLHSPSYKSEIKINAHCSFARIYFDSNFETTYLWENGYKNSTCLFNGYLLNLDNISRTVNEETGGEINTDNPAALIAWLILEKGPKALVELNGIFSFALWHSGTQNLWLGVDRYGMRPLYDSQQLAFVKFASEVKALLFANSGIKPGYLAFEEMFVFGFLLGNKTMFQNHLQVNDFGERQKDVL